MNNLDNLDRLVSLIKIWAYDSIDGLKILKLETDIPEFGTIYKSSFDGHQLCIGRLSVSNTYRKQQCEYYILITDSNFYNGHQVEYDLTLNLNNIEILDRIDIRLPFTIKDLQERIRKLFIDLPINQQKEQKTIDINNITNRFNFQLIYNFLNNPEHQKQMKRFLNTRGIYDVYLDESCGEYFQAKSKNGFTWRCLRLFKFRSISAYHEKEQQGYVYLKQLEDLEICYETWSITHSALKNCFQQIISESKIDVSEYKYLAEYISDSNGENNTIEKYKEIYKNQISQQIDINSIYDKMAYEYFINYIENNFDNDLLVQKIIDQFTYSTNIYQITKIIDISINNPQDDNNYIGAIYKDQTITLMCIAKMTITYEVFNKIENINIFVFLRSFTHNQDYVDMYCTNNIKEVTDILNKTIQYVNLTNINIPISKSYISSELNSSLSNISIKYRVN